MDNDTETEKRSYEQMPPEGKYPLQVVHQMEGGHRIIVSNDRDNPYIAFFHSSGSHVVYRPDGSVDAFNVGNSRTYNKSGVTFTADNNGDVHMVGHKKLHVEGGGHVEIAGDANIVVAGSTNLVGLGGMGAAINGNFYLAASGDMNIHATNINLKGESSFNTEAPSQNHKADAYAVNAPNIGLEGDITHKGNMVTSGTHTDQGGARTHVG